jgi:hypothetical protein
MLDRRSFCRLSAAAAAATAALPLLPLPALARPPGPDLPVGTAPVALDTPWFPSRLHAFVWRNWSLVPVQRLAEVVGARPREVTRMALSLGLKTGRVLSDHDRLRANLTLIRRNWHLLPYDQLLTLLGWSAAELDYTLREDDFFFVKLGLLKPQVAPLRWVAPTAAQQARAAEIARLVRQSFPQGELTGRDPLFSFVRTLSTPPTERPSPVATRVPIPTPDAPGTATPLRLGYSYFALYGDPLIDPSLDPYPEGYLARLAAVGVTGVWLQGVLARLTPLPWDPQDRIERRREALRSLVARAGRHGIRVFLYLNEPRALPKTSEVFVQHPDWRGVPEGNYHAVCTSAPAVQDALRNGIADLCRAVPDLGGFFTITASENQTNCWSHGRGKQCPRCRDRSPAEVIAEVNALCFAGIAAANGRQKLLAWDWGWSNDWALEAIRRLPAGVTHMGVSEWDLPIERGGIRTTIGEYCLSVDRPGPRALRHWAAAKARGLPIAAKLQFGVTWEFAAAPYLPVVENVVRHTLALREAGVDDFMLGWTLGGHPSPNLEAVAEVARGGNLDSLAVRRHGPSVGPQVATFWRDCSAAFREFPYHGGTVYNAPLQMGPANPLWGAPTRYGATMVGLPYDDLDAWRSVYPADVFIAQLEKVASGFEAALARLRNAVPHPTVKLAEELRFAEAGAIHFASVANQSRHVLARRAGNAAAQRQACETERQLAIRLHALQSADARLGFEASNQYFYTPLDLVEKVINCHWLASQTA